VAQRCSICGKTEKQHGRACLDLTVRTVLLPEPAEEVADQENQQDGPQAPARTPCAEAPEAPAKNQDYDQ
jgi:hypothetical protein